MVPEEPVKVQPKPFLKGRTDEITRLTSQAFNRRTTERHFINEVRFSFYNHPILIEALNSGRAVDLVRLPKQKEKCVLLIGSGPTLNEALPYLEGWPGDIICTTSHASTLIYHGREPEHILALDPDSRPDELYVDTWEGRNSILHTHPGVNPDLMKWWKGKIALFRKLQPQTPFYAQDQAIGYGTLGPVRESRYQGTEGQLLVTSQIPMLACAPAAQVCIAKDLGYKQIYLVGCDFSFPDGMYRFADWRFIDGRWKENPTVQVDMRPQTIDPIFQTEYEGLLSSALMTFYSHQVVIAWRITECDIINTSDKGILKVFPYVPFQEVLRRGNKGVKGFSLKRIRAASEGYLAKQNIYVIYLRRGVIPHEFSDPLHDIPIMLNQLKKAMEKQGKGEELDIEANMKRFRRLFGRVSGRRNKGAKNGI